jgi:hypothetical protein
MVWDQLVLAALPLAGVLLGAILSAHSQKVLMRQAHREARVAALSAGFADYLSAYRRFRRFILTEASTVRPVPRDEAGGLLLL